MDTTKKNRLSDGNEIIVRSSLIDAAVFALPPIKTAQPLLNMGRAVLKPKRGKVWVSQVLIGGNVICCSLLSLDIPNHLDIHEYASQKLTPLTKVTYFVLLDKHYCYV